MRAIQQTELANAHQVFNLAGESGIDPERVARERAEQERSRIEAKVFQAKMQRTLSECPGVVGFDLPSCACGKGKVIVEPGRIAEAMGWLKRRFIVAESLELSTDTGLCVEIAPRIRRSPTLGKRIKIQFGKVEQFNLPLGI